MPGDSGIVVSGTGWPGMPDEVNSYKTIERGIESYETPSGQTRYRVRWLEPDGRRRSASFSRLKDARKKHAELQVNRQTGVRSSRHSGMALHHFVEQYWLPEAKQEKSERSLIRDLSIYNAHIRLQLGRSHLASLDPQDIATWKQERLDAGVGAQTLRIAMGILSSIFQKAGVWNRVTGVSTNPVLMVKRPSGRRAKQPTVWHPIVAARLAWILGNDSVRHNTGDPADQDALLISMMAMTGMRPGEAIALRWDDIQNGQIMVNKAVSLKEIKGTKNLRGQRIIPLLDPLAADLEQLRQRRAKDRNRSPFIFAKRNGDHWDTEALRNFSQRHFQAAAAYVEKTWPEFSQGMIDDGVSGVPVSVDGLAETRIYDVGRHSHSALMLSTGMSLVELSQLQGHSIRTLSDNYAQFMAGLEDFADDPAQTIEEIRQATEVISIDIRPAKTRRQIRRRQ